MYGYLIKHGGREGGREGGMHAYIHKSLENAAKVRIWPFCDRRNSTRCCRS